MTAKAAQPGATPRQTTPGEPVNRGTGTQTRTGAPRAKAPAGPGVRASSWLAVAATMFAVAWGGNEFTPLLVMYRNSGEFSPVAGRRNAGRLRVRHRARHADRRAAVRPPRPPSPATARSARRPHRFAHHRPDPQQRNRYDHRPHLLRDRPGPGDGDRLDLDQGALRCRRCRYGRRRQARIHVTDPGLPGRGRRGSGAGPVRAPAPASSVHPAHGHHRRHRTVAAERPGDPAAPASRGPRRRRAPGPGEPQPAPTRPPGGHCGKTSRFRR
jgi:hypothetical protein